MPPSTGRKVGRPRRQQSTPTGEHKTCLIPRESGSPVRVTLECTPDGEPRSARKLRRDRNRQAECYALVKAGRISKTPLTQSDHERRIAACMDETSFDVEELYFVVGQAEESSQLDQREAAAVLRGIDQDVSEKIAAAVHLMTGRRKHHKWTPTGHQRATCERCRRNFALKLDGSMRAHRCIETV